MRIRISYTVDLSPEYEQALVALGCEIGVTFGRDGNGELNPSKRRDRQTILRRVFKECGMDALSMADDRAADSNATEAAA